MNIKEHCNQLRDKLLQLEAEIRMLMGYAGETGETSDNVKLALSHAEDARMRLGLVIHGHDGAPGAMSAAALPMPIGSETHPLPTTPEAHVAPPYTPTVPGAAPPPYEPGPQPGASSPAPATEPQPLDKPADVPPTNTEVAEHEKVAEPVTMHPHNSDLSDPHEEEHPDHHETFPPSHDDKESDINA